MSIGVQSAAMVSGAAGLHAMNASANARSENAGANDDYASAARAAQRDSRQSASTATQAATARHDDARADACAADDDATKNTASSSPAEAGKNADKNAEAADDDGKDAKAAAGSGSVDGGLIAWLLNAVKPVADDSTSKAAAAGARLSDLADSSTLSAAKGSLQQGANGLQLVSADDGSDGSDGDGDASASGALAGDSIKPAGTTLLTTAAATTSGPAHSTTASASAATTAAIDFASLLNAAVANHAAANSAAQSSAQANAQANANLLAQSATPNNAYAGASDSAALQAQAKALSLDHSDWTATMHGHLQLQLDQGLQEAQLELHPRDWGSVQIHLRIVGNEAQLQFSAEHPQARAALAAGLPELRALMASDGLQAQAQVGDQSSARQQSGSSGNSSSHSSAHSSGATRSENAADDDASASSRMRRVIRIGLVDDFA